MIKKLKSLFTSLAVSGMVFFPVLAPVTVHAQLENKINCGADLQIDPDAECEPDDEEATSRINGIIRLVINIFSIVVGVISVIMIIIGGLKYITSGGESSNVTGAKNTILYAVIGLVVVALAQFVVRFVLAKVSTAGE
jgi:hypothetical protein